MGLPCVSFDWLGQLKPIIVTQKTDETHVKSSFYAVKQSGWGPIHVALGVPLSNFITLTPPASHGDTPCGFPD